MERTALFECISKAIETSGEYQRAGDDLNAQEDMAKWAMRLFWATVVTTGVAAFGIYYVRETLVAAVAAANATNDVNRISRSESRPWVTLVRELECEYADRGFGISLCWNYNLVNKGKTPAYNIRLEWTAFRTDFILDAADRLESYVDRRLARGGFVQVPMIFPGESTEFTPYGTFGGATFETGLPGKPIIEGKYTGVMVCIIYSLGIGSDDVGVEARAFEIRESDECLSARSDTLCLNTAAPENDSLTSRAQPP